MAHCESHTGARKNNVKSSDCGQTAIASRGHAGHPYPRTPRYTTALFQIVCVSQFRAKIFQSPGTRSGNMAAKKRGRPQTRLSGSQPVGTTHQGLFANQPLQPCPDSCTQFSFQASVPSLPELMLRNACSVCGRGTVQVPRPAKAGRFQQQPPLVLGQCSSCCASSSRCSGVSQSNSQLSPFLLQRRLRLPKQANPADASSLQRPCDRRSRTQVTSLA